jgi:hypothetical protein
VGRAAANEMSGGVKHFLMLFPHPDSHCFAMLADPPHRFVEGGRKRRENENAPSRRNRPHSDLVGAARLVGT